MFLIQICQAYVRCAHSLRTFTSFSEELSSQFCLLRHNKTLNGWSLERQFVCFLSNHDVSSRYSGKQNYLFPEGPVIHRFSRPAPFKSSIFTVNLQLHCFIRAGNIVLLFVILSSMYHELQTVQGERSPY